MAVEQQQQQEQQEQQVQAVARWELEQGGLGHRGRPAWSPRCAGGSTHHTASASGPRPSGLVVEVSATGPFLAPSATIHMLVLNTESTAGCVVGSSTGRLQLHAGLCRGRAGDLSHLPLVYSPHFSSSGSDNRPTADGFLACTGRPRAGAGAGCCRRWAAGAAAAVPVRPTPNRLSND